MLPHSGLRIDTVDRWLMAALAFLVLGLAVIGAAMTRVAWSLWPLPVSYVWAIGGPFLVIVAGGVFIWIGLQVTKGEFY